MDPYVDDDGDYADDFYTEPPLPGSMVLLAVFFAAAFLGALVFVCH